MPKLYQICDREGGNTIAYSLTYEEANKMVDEFEAEDKDNGDYTPNFYEIIEEDNPKN